MTHAHYTSRSNSNPGRAYRGVETAQVRTTVEVTDTLLECPVCHGGVKPARAHYTDRAAGFIAQKTIVVGAHTFGGGRRSITRPSCLGAYTLLV